MLVRGYLQGCYAESWIRWMLEILASRVAALLLTV